MNRYTANLVSEQQVLQSYSADDVGYLTAWGVELVDGFYCNAICVIVDNKTQKIVQCVKKTSSE